MSTLEELEKRVEDLEVFKEQTVMMFMRLQNALGVSVNAKDGSYQVTLLMPQKGKNSGVVSGIFQAVTKLQKAVEKISDERKIIIPKF